jgi:type VII secretion protein EccE
MADPVTRPGHRAASRPAGDGTAAAPAAEKPAGRPGCGPHRSLFGLSTGQLIAVEAAAALVLLAAAGGNGWLAVGVPTGAALALLALGRFQGRWGYEWTSSALAYATRRRTLGFGGGTSTLLATLRPAARIGTVDLDGAQVGIIIDGYGLTAVAEVGDPTALLADPRPRAPTPAALLPPPRPGLPPVRVQLLIATVTAPAPHASGAPATSYRQLTDGRVPAQQRVFVALQVRRVAGTTDEQLRSVLIAGVRRVRRRLDRENLAGRLLSPAGLARVLAELAHGDGTEPVRESWSAVTSGAVHQASFRLRRWPATPGALGHALLPRLLTAPGCAVVFSVSAEHAQPLGDPGEDAAAPGNEPGRGDQPRAGPPAREPDRREPDPGESPRDCPRARDLAADTVEAEVVVRLAAVGEQALAAAHAALRRLFAPAGAVLQRLDGAQVAGLAATLPLGGAPQPARHSLDGVVDAAAGQPATDRRSADSAALAGIAPAVADGGVVLGLNRRSEPVAVRLFRPEPTQATLLGGLPCARLLALRAIAVGARVIVHSGRPHDWEPFLRGLDGRGDALVVLATGRSAEPVPATPLRPTLSIDDTGTPGNVPAPDAPWCSTLLVRQAPTASDVEALPGVDLVLLQPLGPVEAAIVGRVLGLGGAADWLTRIRPDMVAVVAGRRSLRWALLSPTAGEERLAGPGLG